MLKGLFLWIIIFGLLFGVTSWIIGPTTPETLQAQYPSWTTAQCERVYNHEIWLGMTKDMAFESLGFPDRSNRSVSSAGTRTQWVYKTVKWGRYIGYLYFRNGRLTSWQD